VRKQQQSLSRLVNTSFFVGIKQHLSLTFHRAQNDRQFLGWITDCPRRLLGRSLQQQNDFSVTLKFSVLQNKMYRINIRTPSVLQEVCTWN